MIVATGTVRCVRIGDDYGFTSIADQGGGLVEYFILWWSGIATPGNPSPDTRIRQAEWVALLRQAMASNIIVTVTTTHESANLVADIQLGQG